LAFSFPLAASPEIIGPSLGSKFRYQGVSADHRCDIAFLGVAADAQDYDAYHAWLTGWRKDKYPRKGKAPKRPSVIKNNWRGLRFKNFRQPSGMAAGRRLFERFCREPRF